MVRNLNVEKALLIALNRLLETESVSLHIEAMLSLKDTAAFMAHLPGRPNSVGVMTMWQEWSDTCILCLGESRGQYLRWKEEEGKFMIALNDEMTDIPDFVEPGMAGISLPFILLKDRIVRKTFLTSRSNTP